MRFVRSDEFQEALTLAEGLDARVPTAVEGVCFVIQRRPDAYPAIPGTTVRCATFRLFTAMPALRMYYTVYREGQGWVCSLLGLRGYRTGAPTLEDDEY